MLSGAMADPPARIRYEEFTVEIAPGPDGTLRSRVLESPGGGGTADFVPPFDEAARGMLLTRLETVVLRSAVPQEAGEDEELAAHLPDPVAVGRALHDSLFSGAVGRRFAYSQGVTRADGGTRGEPGAPQTGLRLRILLPPGPPPAAAAVASLPWELIYDEESRDFLGRGRLTPVVRCLDVPGAHRQPAAEPPVGVLVAMAAPAGSQPLDFDRARRRIADSWGGHPALRVDFLPHATLEAVRDKLLEGRFHVLHFAGHGRFDEITGEGRLLFEDDAGSPHPVAGRVLADTLRDAPPLHLVVLNACATGRFPRRRGLDPYTGVATALVAAGLPAVVAMQFPVTNFAAREFGRRFYHALAAGDPLEAAVAEGRHAVYRARPESYEWATPVLFLRGGQGGETFEGVVRERPLPEPIRSQIDDASSYVELKSRDFVGRGFVFDALESFFTQAGAGYFLLVGEPGIGKTAVAAELVRRHGHPHHFNRRSDGIVLPEAFLGNLCAQLIARYRLEHASLPPAATRDAGFLNALLAEVSRRLAPGERCLFLVDALDESRPEGLPTGANPLYLPSHLPPGVFCLATTRPSLTLRSDSPVEPLELDPRSPQNLADLRKLIDRHQQRPGIVEYRRRQGIGGSALADLLEERSAGNFMYLSLVLDALEREELRGLAPDELPRGLLGYYLQHWALMRGEDEEAFLEWKQPVLLTLAVTPEPLPLELIVRLSGVPRPRVQRALELWRPFLHLTHPLRGSGEPALYSVYHQSFREFLEQQSDVEGAQERFYERLMEDDEDHEDD